MKIAVAADHGGFPLKAPIVELLKKLGHEVVDLGAHQYDAKDDYPDFAHFVSEAIQHKQADRGIVVCGSGVGACVAANKHKGVRASVCHDTYTARQGVEHDDLNVLCIGARVIGIEVAQAVVEAFARAKFLDKEPRFVRRLEKVIAFEDAN